MGLRRGTVALTACIGVGLSAACSAVLGITDFTPAEGGSGPGDATTAPDQEGVEGGSSGVAGHDGSGDSSGGGGCSSAIIDGGLAALGCPCSSSQAGELASE